MPLNRSWKNLAPASTTGNIRQMTVLVTFREFPSFKGQTIHRQWRHRLEDSEYLPLLSMSYT